MVRIVKEHDERRMELLNTAQQLFAQKGYEQTSVREVIKEVGVAKGTFYHYFDSKLNLLDELIERMVDVSLAGMGRIVNDSELDALEKLNRFFDDTAKFKLENRALLLKLLQPYFSPDNAIFRQKINEQSVVKVAPLLGQIFSQGTEEGVFQVAQPKDMAEIIIRLSQGLSEEIAMLFLNAPHNTHTFETIAHKTAVHNQAIERLLNAPEGTIHLIKLDQIQSWFGE